MKLSEAIKEFIANCDETYPPRIRAKMMREFGVEVTLSKIEEIQKQLNQEYNDSLNKRALNAPIYKEAISLLEKASMLVGNPGTNISGSTDIACDNWQKEWEKFKNTPVGD